MSTWSNNVYLAAAAAQQIEAVFPTQAALETNNRDNLGLSVISGEARTHRNLSAANPYRFVYTSSVAKCHTSLQTNRPESVVGYASEEATSSYL